MLIEYESFEQLFFNEISLSNTIPHGSGLGTCQRGSRKLLRGKAGGPFY